LHQHDVETFQLEQFINLEKIQIIVSPYHTNIKHTLYQRGLLSKLKTTAKSITMINMRVSTHDSAISPSIKNISFVHCFIGASFSSRTIPNVTLSFQDCVTGVQRSEMENIKFLEFMRQYGFNVGYMIGNSVSYALQKNQKELFHVCLLFFCNNLVFMDDTCRTSEKQGKDFYSNTTNSRFFTWVRLHERID
jgi:hypothetical protein